MQIKNLMTRKQRNEGSKQQARNLLSTAYRLLPTVVCLLSIALAATLAAMRGAQADSPVYAIRNVKIVTVTGAVIPRGTVLIRDGKIAAIGETVAVPADAKVIDGKGTLSVYPGMIDSGTTLGLTEIGQVRETIDTTELGQFNPHMRAIVAVQPNSELIPVTRANGITSALTSPQGGLISGQSAMINLDGFTPKEMTLKAPVAMHFNYPGGGGGRRGGGGGGGQFQAEGADQQATAQLDSLRKKLDDAIAYAKAKEARARDKSLPAAPTDLALEALIPVIKGELPVLMSANRERDMRGAIDLADKYKLKLIITGADEALKVASLLKQKNVPVIIGPVLELPRGEDDSYDAAYAQAGELFKAGVKFSIQTNNSAYARSLPYHAGIAARVRLAEGRSAQGGHDLSGADLRRGQPRRQPRSRQDRQPHRHRRRSAGAAHQRQEHVYQRAPGGSHNQTHQALRQIHQPSVERGETES